MKKKKIKESTLEYSIQTRIKKEQIKKVFESLLLIVFVKKIEFFFC